MKGYLKREEKYKRITLKPWMDIPELLWDLPFGKEDGRANKQHELWLHSGQSQMYGAYTPVCLAGGELLCRKLILVKCR